MIFLETNCENNTIEVFDKNTSILYDFVVIKTDKQQVYLNNSFTNPLVTDFLNPSLNTKVELYNEKGWLNIDAYYFKQYTLSFTVVDRNELHFTGIYNAFIGYDYILIDQEVYKIDKSKSSENVLFLATPLKKDVVNYTVGKGIKQSKIGYNICEETSKLVKNILSLTCKDCTTEYQKYHEILIKLQLLKSNCISDDDIKQIVDSFTYAVKQC